MNYERGSKEHQLILAVLQVLLSARRKRPVNGGASGRMLMDCLNLDDTTELESALRYLRDKDLIEPGERVFMITAKGVDYIEEHFPPEPPQSEPPAGSPGPSAPPWSPGDPPNPWPPRMIPMIRHESRGVESPQPVLEKEHYLFRILARRILEPDEKRRRRLQARCKI